MITYKKIKEVLAQWGIEKERIADIFSEREERNEHAFYVGEDYVIKFYSNLGKLKNHIEISKALQKNGLHFAAPICTLDGKEFIENEQLYFILTKRLKGNRIDSKSIYEGDFAGKARFIGEIIGHLSLALKEVEVEVNEADIYDSTVNWALPKIKKSLNFPNDLFIAIKESFGAICNELPRQIIHRDPNPGNMIVEGNNWGFVDFELSERNVRIYDPCYAATAILSESFDSKNQDKLTKWTTIYHNIILGYDNVAKLSKEEKKAIPFIILSNQLICCAWLSEQDKYKEMFDTNAAMTKWIWEHFEELVVE